MLAAPPCTHLSISGARWWKSKGEGLLLEALAVADACLRIIEAVKPALIKHGLFFTQHPQPSENGITVETFLHHAGGESLSLGSLFVPANKQDAQGFGSALTYARRYSLSAIACIAADEDDDAEAQRSTVIEDHGPQLERDTIGRAQRRARHAAALAERPEVGQRSLDDHGRSVKGGKSLKAPLESLAPGSHTSIRILLGLALYCDPGLIPSE